MHRDEAESQRVRLGRRAAWIADEGEEGEPDRALHRLNPQPIVGVPARVVVQLFVVGAVGRRSAIGPVGPVAVAGDGRLDGVALEPAIAHILILRDATCLVVLAAAARRAAGVADAARR